MEQDKRNEKFTSEEKIVFEPENQNEKKGDLIRRESEELGELKNNKKVEKLKETLKQEDIEQQAKPKQKEEKTSEVIKPEQEVGEVAKSGNEVSKVAEDKVDEEQVATEREDDKTEESEEQPEQLKQEDSKKSEQAKPESEQKESTESTEDKYRVEAGNKRRIHPVRRQKDKGSKKPSSKKQSGKADKDEGKVKSAKDSLVKSKSIVKKAARAISFLVNLVLINPLFWLAVLLFIVMSYVFAFTSVVGQNDYNILCDPSGTGIVILSSDAEDFTRQSAVAAWLMSTPFDAFGGNPMTREQAAGVIGNFNQESYNTNPKAIQNYPIDKWSSCGNDCVLAFGDGTVYNKAIGMAQWDGIRRVRLVEFAKEKGTEWYNINTQLAFIKKEIDSEFGEKLVKEGFINDTKTASDTAYIWHKVYEVSADTEEMIKDRQDSAETFAKEYIGSTGLATHCIGTMSFDMSNLVELAIASSWPTVEESRTFCDAYINCGQNDAKPAYIEARKVAEATTEGDGITGWLASCDRFVATMLRATGTDVSIPWSGVKNMDRYMRNSIFWTRVPSCAERQPGDVLVESTDQWHIALYVGNVNGVDSIAHASIGVLGEHSSWRTAALSKVSCQGIHFFSGEQTFYAYRKVG